MFFYLKNLLLVSVCLLVGCVAPSYRYGITQHPTDSPFGDQEYSDGSRVHYGVDRPNLDNIERIVQAPRNLLLKSMGKTRPDDMSRKALTENNLALTQQFLRTNGIEEIHIDVKTYAPRRQWKRLVSNNDISPIWKYTGGTINWLKYTVFPNRVFHRDEYDPFTNTLSLNSTRETSGLFEAASAKEYRKQLEGIGVGNYAMLQFVPLVPIYHHANAATDVLTYSRFHLNSKTEMQLFPLVWSRIGESVSSEAISISTLDSSLLTTTAIRLSGRLIGRLVGKTIVQTNRN